MKTRDAVESKKLHADSEAGFWIVRTWEMRENEDDDPSESLFGPFATEDEAERFMNRDDVIDWAEVEDARAEYVNNIPKEEQ